MVGRRLARPLTSEATRAREPLDEDASLVVTAKADPRAFALLYARYADPVYRYCLRRLGESEAAADATSRIFVKALAALPGYRDDARSFRAWLFAIAHNTLIDEVRARRWTTPLEFAGEVASAAPSPEDELLAAEAGIAIRGLLAGLPPDQRAIMELRLAGLTGPEIAAAVGRSLGAVKIAQVRSFARLRGLLGVRGDPSQETRRDER